MSTRTEMLGTWAQGDQKLKSNPEKKTLLCGVNIVCSHPAIASKKFLGAATAHHAREHRVRETKNRPKNERTYLFNIVSLEYHNLSVQ